MAILGICCSTAAPGGTPSPAGSFVDRVEKCSAETSAFFDAWLHSNSPTGILDEDRESDAYVAFGRFMALAGQAGEADIEECVARLPSASPRTAALLLAVLFHQNRLRLLPTIARFMDDKRVAFRYENGSPDFRFRWRISDSAFGIPPPELVPKTQSVGEIARSLLQHWGFYTFRETFDEFWMVRKDRPYSAIEIFLWGARAKDEVTGEPDDRQIRDVLRRIESLPVPAKHLIRAALALPRPKDDPDRYEPGRRRALAALDKQTVIGVLRGREPIIPGDPDLSPKALNGLYNSLVRSILKHYDVHFTEAELADVMKDASESAKIQLKIVTNDREVEASRKEKSAGRLTFPGGEPLVCTRWEPRRYLGDERPFLVKFKEIAAEIEVFPFQWIVFPGTLSGDFLDNWLVTHEDAQRFYHFADLVRTATKDDLRKCVDFLAEASPKQRVLLLVALHFSLDDAYLPAIARYVGDDSVPFARCCSQEDAAWKKEHHWRSWGEGVALGREVKRKSEAGVDLNCFERRVLHDNRRFDLHYKTGIGPEASYSLERTRHLSDYALAILKLRGFGLVESARDALGAQSRSSMVRGSYGGQPYGAGYKEGPAFGGLHSMSDAFGERAWKELRSLPLGVRRLRHEYMLRVECVSPPCQQEAAAEFAKRLEEVPARTAALALVCACPEIVDPSRRDEMLIPDWPAIVRRIPKEQVLELLTGTDLARIDADLASERQSEFCLGYPPYLERFLTYVLANRSKWFGDSEFKEIEPRLSPAARAASKWVGK